MVQRPTSVSQKILLALFFGIAAFPLPVFASQVEDIIRSLIGLANLLIILCATIALLVFVWGIVKLIAAASNPDKIKEAKGIIWWGIIGLAVLASISGLILFLQGYFGIPPSGAPIRPPQF